MMRAVFWLATRPLLCPVYAPRRVIGIGKDDNDVEDGDDAYDSGDKIIVTAVTMIMVSMMQTNGM